MERILYVTEEKKGYGKQNYYCNKYTTDGSEVFKYRCHRQKFFDGEESYWDKEENLESTWDKDDPNMPEWLHKFL